MNIKPPADRFKATSLAMVNRLCDILEEEGKFTKIETQLLYGAVSAKSPEELCHKFIENTHTHWERIRCKDEAFFKENAGSLFTQFSKTNIDKVKEAIQGREEEMWKRLQALVRISINHIHEKRSPCLVDGEPKYNEEYFPGIELHTVASSWEATGLKPLSW